MAEDLVIKYCSPTLAGIKAGSLFSLPTKDRQEALVSLRNLNRTLSSKGVVFLPLKYREKSVLVYAYRPVLLSRHFADAEVSELLKRFGYNGKSILGQISHLISRFKDNSDFPHEIGLFLDYPAKDVLGFIENEGRMCKCVGCWKVYDDEENAVKTFEKYQKCTEIYSKLWNKERSLKRLTVAV